MCPLVLTSFDDVLEITFVNFFGGSAAVGDNRSHSLSALLSFGFFDPLSSMPTFLPTTTCPVQWVVYHQFSDMPIGHFVCIGPTISTVPHP